MGTNFFERLEALNAKKSELQREFFLLALWQLIRQ